MLEMKSSVPPLGKVEHRDGHLTEAGLRRGETPLLRHPRRTWEGDQGVVHVTTMGSAPSGAEYL